MNQLPVELLDIIHDYSLLPPFPVEGVLRNIIPNDREQYGIDIFIAYGSDVYKVVKELLDNDTIINIALTRSICLSDKHAGDLFMKCVLLSRFDDASQILFKYPYLRPKYDEQQLDPMQELYLSFYVGKLGYAFVYSYITKKVGTILYNECIKYLNNTPINPAPFISSAQDGELYPNEHVYAAINPVNLATLIMDNGYNIGITATMKIVLDLINEDYIELAHKLKVYMLEK